MNISLRQMHQFVAVAEELHYGRAAARLNMAQPPLSQSLQRLEAALGFALLERSSRKVTLTPAGHVFCGEAKRTLAQAEAAQRLARQVASEEVAEVTIGFVSAAVYRLLPETLRGFRRKYPGVQIRLEEQPTDLQVKSLLSGAIDLGFLHPPIEKAEGVALQVVHRDPFVAAVPANSVLAEAKSLDLADLAEQDFVSFPYRLGPNLYRSILTACRQAGFAPRITQEARLMSTILSLVAAEMGIALVPDGARSLGRSGVVFLPLAGLPEDLVWELAIVWRQDDRRAALLRLLKAVEAAAGAMPGAAAG